jgi:rSAM/selenodomain-associated transferase 2
MIPPERVRLSIVIPALDEEALLGETLARVRAAIGLELSSPPREALEARGVEILVVDASGGDATAAVADRAGARVLRSPRARGLQLDTGARAARGEVFLFLHADSHPPAGFLGDIERALAAEGPVLGAWRLGFEAPERRYRLLERATDLRLALTATPYGDQGLFCRSADYFESGGFPPWPLLEDVALVRRFRELAYRRGAWARMRPRILPARVTTSARRYRAKGFLRALLRNRVSSLLWALHMPPRWILALLGVRYAPPAPAVPAG